jgi:hypothetical protein
MANDNQGKATHEVVHPSLYFAVAGKMQLVEKGSHITLTAAQAARLGDKVLKLGNPKVVDVNA